MQLSIDGCGTCHGCPGLNFTLPVSQSGQGSNDEKGSRDVTKLPLKLQCADGLRSFAKAHLQQVSTDRLPCSWERGELAVSGFHAFQAVVELLALQCKSTMMLSEVSATSRQQRLKIVALRSRVKCHMGQGIFT